jgi:serine/threonine protein phosphatase 1
MAIQSVQPDGTFEAWQPWMKRGGKSTYASYIVQSNGDLYEAKDRMLEDFMWLDTLPTELVLDRIRLVHAGYNPQIPLDMQGEKELLWIRKEWYLHEGSVDPSRTVFFGHTTTTKLGDAAGEVAFSSNQLPDGRPAWVGLDVGAYNHVSPKLAAVNISSFRIVEQPTLRCDRWFERINTRPKSTGKKKTWKGQENLREAEVARSSVLALWCLGPRTPAGQA